ncbi:MAG: sigma-54 dependent transcriptional regulator [Desulfohalobiaceae bacterium]|nr:sigma-54 dependent transcriptional regulator [Desulfohalobiaceae bacterium]
MRQKTRILVIDDEPVLRESLQAWLERDGYSVEAVASGGQGLNRIAKTRFDLVFLDLKLEDIDGIQVLTRIKEDDPDTSVVMITAYGSVPSAVEAMKQGAEDYLLKPFEPEELSVLIEKIITHKAREQENIFLRTEQRERTRFESLLGQSEPMQEIFSFIEDISPTDSTVLITGETGTGKELAAKAIHSRSHRCEGPFVAVNCGSLPEQLMESELFGYEQGAFTDAKQSKKGRLELAGTGTLFLDEVGEIGPRMQIDLLRVLEERSFTRLGGTRPIGTDIRVIAASNKDLPEAVRAGYFREDLYYRLNVISLEMPPLRKRKEDIPLLAEHFLSRFRQETKKEIEHISRQALDLMMLYDWPGNVRELENAIERAVVVGKGKKIQPEDLPISREPGLNKEGSLQEMEKVHIQQVLKQNDWNISRSAKILGIDRSTLYKKIRRYNIR